MRSIRGKRIQNGFQTVGAIGDDAIHTHFYQALHVRRVVGCPHEYLDASIDRVAGMQPGEPVFIVLELYVPADNAVSFEFGFL